MEKALNVRLVSPSVWQKRVETALDPLPHHIKPVAESILATLHNRHIGISPALAAELAQRISDPYAYKSGKGRWEYVLKRLLAESSEGLQGVAIMLSSIPLYSVLRLAGPIIEETCTRSGWCFLFCQDELQNGVTIDQYNEYEFNLENEMRQMALDRSDFFNTFWKDRALTLASYSGRAPIWSSSRARLADIDPPALGMLLRLKPIVKPAKAMSLHPRTMINPLKHREIKRMREGGVSGIHITRRMEDMGDIMMSEFLNPPAVLADRLINNGFTALRRQTRREQIRDVLVVGILPEGIEPRLSVDFIKSCWFDFIARFGFMLYRSRLLRSEFRWLEGDALERMRTCNYLLKELPDLEIPVEGDLTPSFRREFLMALGWLPGFLDTRGHFEKVPAYAAAPQQLDVAGETGTQLARTWVYSAWRSQKEHQAWERYEYNHLGMNKNNLDDNQLDTGRYAFVHIMVFLPAGKCNQDASSAAARLGPLYSGLGLGQAVSGGGQFNASITWVPEELTASNQWVFDCRGNLHSTIFTQEQWNWPLNRIAGRMQEIWRQQLLKELQDG